MKLKQLTINNIASIEHADIDFSGAPLDGERLFLITGETGSGKSTIIDCLCLALYGKTPRLKGRNDVTYDTGVNQEIGVNDPRQLMRRDSVEASVTLTFEAGDGTPYIATWEVHRANKKPTGAIQDIKRSLETAEGHTPALHFNKSTEVDDHIKGLLGLELDQFFRTAVLAQGKFAEFLHSSGKDKADLLEKMTGTQIYSDLGIKINELTKEKEDAYKILLGQSKEIALLTEEEKKELNDNISRLNLEQQAVGMQVEQAQALNKWHSDMERIAQEIKQTSDTLNDKRKQTDTSEHQQQQALVWQWDHTADARHHLKGHNEALKIIGQLEHEKTAMQTEYQRLCADLEATVTDLGEKQRKANDINSYLKQEEANRAMYEAMGEIKSNFQQLAAEQGSHNNHNRQLNNDQQRLPVAQKTLNEAQAQCKTLQAAANELRQQQEELNISDISDRKDRLAQAVTALEKLKELHTGVENAQASLSQQRQDRSEETAALQKDEALLQPLQERREKAWQATEQQKNWNELIKQAHNTLHEGDSCPVCGQVIKQLAPQGESLLDTLSQQFKAADQEWNGVFTRIKAARKHMKSLDRLIAQAQQQQQLQIDARDRHWQQTQGLLAACGHHVSTMAGTSLADKLIGEMQAQVKQLDQTLRAAEKLKGQLNEAHRRLDQAQQAQQKALAEVNQIMADIKHRKELIDNSNKKILEYNNTLDSLLTVPGWKEQASSRPDFITSLERAATRYKQQVQEAQSIAVSIQEQGRAVAAMRECQRGIKGLEDSGTTVAGGKTHPGLERQWRQLATRNVEWNTQLNNAKQTAERSHSALQAFLDSHPDITINRIEALSQHRQEDVEEIRRALQQLADAITSLKGAHDALIKQQDQRQRQKPDFDMERDKLGEFISEGKQRQTAITGQMADLKSQLKADEEKAEMARGLKARLDKAEAEFRQWERLNKLLGDSKGNTFRTIAQSYILGDLLDNANGYLRQFMGRYELVAKPGSLTILARDLIHGNFTSVNTLSGGETFMASLALALALSGITGGAFAVDTIFIDEGFGSLSEDYLDNVMETLNRLHDMVGRRVGIISHVGVLKERIPTQIKVSRNPHNNTASLVQVTG